MLKNTYAANARLFHDFRNHIEALRRYLEKDRTAETVRYLEELRFINLTIRRINEMLLIKLENGCQAAPVVEEGC